MGYNNPHLRAGIPTPKLYLIPLASNYLTTSYSKDVSQAPTPPHVNFKSLQLSVREKAPKPLMLRSVSAVRNCQGAAVPGEHKNTALGVSATAPHEHTVGSARPHLRLSQL